ncbi:phosphate acyltransferase [Candidatus Kuenenia stuttgartiensis]|uniref:Phosphate acyltransferase n=2 Tax=Candidatus Brocadiaceae TaxID=1127830 RepID=Q1PYH2_KUEST|nr:phosphate acyltransferase PlsX [Planctomycetia bacterium]MBW7941063.1 phosphate acyltransferase PlsX [Candidatus Kuenenia stuttgartiensis]MBZ0193279.1 phosphate acyltransferase PlsX [Candidatus Kuenenia stuttgartiensis]MCF6152115.1 phosphate acyltransferase PlsX [Candidatus Kuenenia stuttgartiensis]MCL4727699.1 phosphate acyltransferase PlsX [Candidatus Kuenenia stuttgartiensis]
MRIAVDAMGGDKAPQEIVKGSVLAAQQVPDAEIILVGDENRIKHELCLGGTIPKNITIHHAAQIVGMEDPATHSIRQKINSSITQSVELVAKRKADAIVSAGHTGATVAAAMLHMKTLKGIRRPGIAISLPTLHGSCLIIDAGANISCKPLHLYQYGIMASTVCKHLMNIENPKVGLLNIGEEDAKGNDLVRETFSLLSNAHLNFIGNIESREIFDGKADVVVCEGFVGNVILKFAEGMAKNLLTTIKAESMNRFWAKLGLLLCKPVFQSIKTKMDFAEYGGVPLLGINGICIICHGRSDARTIQNAIKAALKLTKTEINEYIISELEKSNTLTAEVA